MNFGVVKNVTAFALFISCTTGCGGVYSSDGKTLKAHETGLDANYTQGASDTHIVYNPTSGQEPTYPLFQDIDADTTTSASVTANAEIAMNVSTHKSNGTASDATRLELSGVAISDQSGVGTSTRLSYEVEHDGQSHWYAYNTSTNQWVEIVSIGIRSSGSDEIAIYSVNNLTDSVWDIAIYGKSNKGQGVWGETASGTGVSGSGGTSGDGVSGSTSGSGDGVTGTAAGGIGVSGRATTGVGVQASAVSGGTSFSMVPQDMNTYTDTPQNGFRVYNSNATWGTKGFWKYEEGAWVKE